MFAPGSSFYQCNFYVNLQHYDQCHESNNYYYGNCIDNGYADAMEVEEDYNAHYGAANNVLSINEEVHVVPINDKANVISINDTIIRQNPMLHQQCHFTPFNRTFHLLRVSEFSQDYEEISGLFYATMKNGHKITQMDRIVNPYMYGAYLLKKEQLMRRNPGNWEEYMLFHGTKKNNVNDICKYNFNWRLCGSGTGRHKFGQGVSFSPSASYAAHYCNSGKKKVMLLCNVLMKNKCIGHQNMVLPDYECDTSVNETQQVFVKYEDNEFYPLYKICFISKDNYVLNVGSFY